MFYLVAFVAGVLVGFTLLLIVYLCNEKAARPMPPREIAVYRETPRGQSDYNAGPPEACCTLYLFPDANMPCNTFYKSLVYGKQIMCRKTDCAYIHHNPLASTPMTSLMRIMKLMQGAREILICMYCFGLWEMLEYLCLLKRHSGTQIRMITDSSQDYKVGSKIPELIRAGVEVKMPTKQEEGDSLSLMHHKFAIIDKKFTLSGSLNWTYRGVSRNRELVMCSKNPTIVRRLTVEFESMWSECKRVAEDEFKNLKWQARLQ